MSNRTLCPTTTESERNSRNEGRTSSIGGAAITIACVIPVITVTVGGIGDRGFTSVWNRPISMPPS